MHKLQKKSVFKKIKNAVFNSFKIQRYRVITFMSPNALNSMDYPSSIEAYPIPRLLLERPAPYHSLSNNTRALQEAAEHSSLQDSNKSRNMASGKLPTTLYIRSHINELLLLITLYRSRAVGQASLQRHSLAIKTKNKQQIQHSLKLP